MPSREENKIQCQSQPPAASLVRPRAGDAALSALESEPRVLTVLIAEDDPIIRSFMTAMTSKIGHPVIAAADGLEALRLWESERPGLILMDVQMPNLDGLEATRMIREREKELGGEVPIYGLTAHMMPEDVRRCLDAGMTGHLGKPIDFGKVRETLKRHETDQALRGVPE